MNIIGRLPLPSFRIPFQHQGVLLMSRITMPTKMICFALLAAPFFLLNSLHAQSGAGSIQGTVRDATASAIPACTIHVVNQATGVANDTTSNANGFYSVQGLFAGNYTMTMSRMSIPSSAPCSGEICIRAAGSRNVSSRRRAR